MKLLALLALALLPTSAHADDHADHVLEAINPMLNWLQATRTEAASTLEASKPTAAECHAAIAAGKKAGLTDATKLYANGIFTLAETQYDDKHDAYITLADADKLCTEYGKWLLIAPAAAAQAYALQNLTQYSTMTGENEPPGTEKTLIDVGTKCLTATDAAIKAGAPADWKTTIYKQPMTLGEGRDKACQALVTFGKSWIGKVGKAEADRIAKVRAKYAALGIKGKRLDLYVETDNTYWLGAGCEKITDNKKLVNATKLYQQWDAPDGTITIRTYTFKGDSYTIKNTTYDTQARAHRGCI